MTRKKSNVKALALAVTCAILAGGGIGLEPVYAADAVTYDTTTNKLNAATSTEIKKINVGGAIIGATTTTSGDVSSVTAHLGGFNNVLVNDGLTVGAVGGTNVAIGGGGIVATSGANNVTIGNGAITATGNIEGNDITAKGNLSVTGTSTFTGNTTFAKGISAANSKFTVDEYGNIKKASSITTYTNTLSTIGGVQFKSNNIDTSGAITAGSLTLGTDYDVKQNIEDAKAKINTVEGNLSTNQANLTALQGRVDGHDTDINALKTKTQDIKYENDGSTTVDGVNFNGGAVSGVTSINNTHVGGVTLSGGTIEAASGKFKVYDNGAIEAAGGVFKVGSSGTINALGIQTHSNGSITLNDKLFLNAADASLQDKAAGKAVSVAEMANTRDNTQKISYTADGTKIDSDVIINEGKKNQVKITKDEGIVVGLDSSVVNADGVFAGGHNYTGAKAALNASDGSIKGADGKFGVDKDGNVTTEGALKGKTLGIGTNGSEFTVDENGNTNVGGTLDVTGATTLGSTLNVTGKTTLNDELQVDKTATFGSATGSQTVIEGGNIKADGMLTSASAKIGSVGIDNTGAITGVTSLTTNALTVTGAFTTGNLTVNGDLTASGAINGKTISINDGGSIAGVNFETGGKLTATTGTIGGVTFATGGVVSGVNDFTSTIIRDGAGTIITSGNVESKTAKIGAISIDNEKIEGSSANGLTIENVKIKDGVVSDVTSLTANSATIGGVNTLDNTGIKVATGNKIQVGSKTVIEDGSIAVSTNTKLTDQALNLNTTNTWTAAGGLVADKATVNGVVLGADGDTGKATFTDANGSTTIAGKNITTGKIIADELLIDKISLGKNGSSNISIDNSGNVTTEGEITIKDATGAVMSKLSQDKATFGKDAMNKTTISKGDITATAKNAADSQQSTLTHNNKGFKVEGKDAGGTKASSFGFDTSTGIGTFTGQDNSTTAIDGSKMTLVNGDNRTELTAGGVTFTGKDYKDATAKGTTVIDGNTITTGKLVTDELVITGQGNADGNGGSIAFGGNGTIKSDINDGNGKNTSFETKLDGVNTKVTDGTTTTENQVTAAGNSNTVTKDEKHKSEFNQGLTSIGGVVTNGTINVAQNLDGVNGLLTNEVTDADGKSSMLKQSGTGLTYTDSANTGNETRINSSDVSIGSASDPDKRINLSDLGQIDELDQEIRNNEEYQNNKTAVGGINAEAAIRRGEVERLDNRISEEVTRLDGRINDVNDRVNKVGAMAAAIASLKSIGYDPQAPSEFSIGLGQYKGETGVAMGFFHYPNKNFMINVSLSTAGGETMGGIGATWRFGHKSPQKLLEEQREEQAKKELAAAEKYQAAAKLAKEAQERAEYAAKLARQAQVSADNAKAAADATQAKHFG